ncbi:hypothetical protein GCM10022221_67830 [Actinocorallia aurea]
MGEPKVTVRAVHYSTALNTPIKRIVIHATCPPGVPFPTASARGKAASTAKYFASQASGGSAHYIVDAGGASTEEHCLPDDAVAWHAPPNTGSIGIEICGQATYTRAQWLDSKVWPAVAAAAARTRELCERHGVPVKRLTVAQVARGERGVCGHVDVSQAFDKSDHTDPGPNFPWEEFMKAVRGESTTKQESGSLKILASLKATKPLVIQPGQRRSIVFDTELKDPKNMHADGAYPALFPHLGEEALATLSLTVSGLAPDAAVRVAFARYERDTNTLAGDVYGEDKAAGTGNADGVAEFVLTGLLWLDPDQKYRADVVNLSGQPITVTKAWWKVDH